MLLLSGCGMPPLSALKWSCFLGQVCGLAKIYQVFVHAAFRILNFVPVSGQFHY